MDIKRNIIDLVRSLKYLQVPSEEILSDLFYHIIIRKADTFSVRVQSVHQQKDDTQAVVFHHMKFKRDSAAGAYVYEGRNAVRASPGKLDIPTDHKDISDDFRDRLLDATDILPGERLTDFSRRREHFRNEIERELLQYRQDNPELFSYLIGMIVPSTGFRLSGDLHQLQQNISKQYVNSVFIPHDLHIDLPQSEAMLTGAFAFIPNVQQWIGVDMKAPETPDHNQPLIRLEKDYDPISILTRHALFKLEEEDLNLIKAHFEMGKDTVLPANHFARPSVEARTNPLENGIDLYHLDGKPYAHLYPDKWLYHNAYKADKAERRRMEPGHPEQVAKRRGNTRHIALRRQRQKDFKQRRK